jgi:outer membrane autotransporter protein
MDGAKGAKEEKMKRFLGKKMAGVLSALLLMGIYGHAEAKDYLNTHWMDDPDVEESDTSNQFYIDSSDPSYEGADEDQGNVGIWVKNHGVVSITATEGDNTATSRDSNVGTEAWWGVSVSNTATLNLTATKGSNHIIGLGENDYGVGVYEGSHLNMTAGTDNKIQGAAYAVWGNSTANDFSLNYPITINIKSTGGNNEITSISTSDTLGAHGIQAVYKVTVDVTADAGNNIISASAADGLRTYGIYAYSSDASVNLTAAEGSNTVSSSHRGVYSAYSNINLTAGKDNTVEATSPGSNVALGVYGWDGTVNLTSENGNNTVTVTGPTDSIGVSNGGRSGNEVINLLAKNGSNEITVTGINDAAEIYGIQNMGGTVTVSATNGNNTIKAKDASNAFGIYDYLGGTKVTAENGNNEITSSNAAVYSVASETEVTATGGSNIIEGTEAGVYATLGGSVKVNGTSQISSDNIALIAASPYTDSTQTVNAAINVNYGAGSSINGDIAAMQDGTVTITPASSDGTINVTSNIVAYGHEPIALDPSDPNSDTREAEPSEYEGGTVELDLTDGSMFTGTSSVAYDLADDKGTEREGTVNIDLPAQSLWYMTDSSSVTKLSGNGGTVYFQNGGYSLQIGTLTGSHTFAMDLSMDGTQSDMLYINNGTSDEQTLQIKNLAELDSEMQPGDAVRFAVVGDSLDEFRDGKVVAATTSSIYRNTLSIEYRDVATDPLNTTAYNDEYNGDGTMKPTTDDVNALYVEPYTDPQNVYVVKTAEELNDGAVTPGRNRDLVWRYITTLDTFTKRDGQSRYFTDEGDRGGWIRLGYSDLGIDGVGEMDGNTYELGWTTISRQNKERKHRFSASVAYGKPEGSFEGYGGDLEVRDFSVNLYDTHEYYPSAEKLAKKPAWKKDSHAYWDNYLKYHHVKTEYDAYDHVVGTNYSGDYSQNVWNLSTEYGHKLMMNEDWFWVPQAQLQLSYLGSYDYTDSQGLRVDGDHDWSLIGRLGFDVVRDFRDKQESKLYLKASLLHEFMDGNDVTIRYDSDRYVDEGDQSGTWGVVGLGYSSKIGDEQYFYLDAERYFGNDFERTYDIRAGVNWKF